MLWHSSYLKEIFSTLTYNAYPNYLDQIMTSWKMENSMFTLQLDRLFSIWINGTHCMRFWVCTVGTYRASAIIGRVHTAFFNYHYFSKMTNMPDVIF